MKGIKFRTWNKKCKYMDDDIFVHAHGNLYDYAERTWDTPNIEIEKDYDDNHVFMQFTGLKDKNGKEIYEGDILQGYGNPKDLVKIVFGEFGVIDVNSLETIDTVIGWHYEVIPADILSRCEPFNISMPLTEYYINRCEFEVIGNIYENPELLKEVEE